MAGKSLLLLIPAGPLGALTYAGSQRLLGSTNPGELVAATLSVFATSAVAIFYSPPLKDWALGRRQVALTRELASSRYPKTVEVALAVIALEGSEVKPVPIVENRPASGRTSLDDRSSNGLGIESELPGDLPVEPAPEPATAPVARPAQPTGQHAAWITPTS
jgi:hypothetical protein